MNTSGPQSTRWPAMVPGQRRRSLLAAVARIVAAAVVFVGGYSVIPFERATLTQLWLVVGAAVAMLVVLSVMQLRAVAAASLPLLRGIEALVVVFVFLLVAFAGIYIAVSSRDPASFSEPLDHVDALYFALTTLTTVGYGDISPVSNPARLVVMVQMVIDVLMLGVFIKLLTDTVASRRGG